MGIDLNTIDEGAAVDGEEETPAVAAAAVEAVMCLELWHACAGPLISLPRKGSVVVYLPQGHIEQTVGAEARRVPAVAFDAPPHVFCRVIDVKLRAEMATDEVYAQLSLVAEGEELEKRLMEDGNNEDADEDDTDGVSKLASIGTPHMFCKTLTASDTSTHGGFSVPRRAAEDCFPPLDYKQQRPSQELVAKDLHGVEWRFRHIYRGQPRRHLLTTGWSAFVNKKKLVSGDAVLFLRGDNGELRLGIRRATQLKNTVPSSPLYDQTLYLNSLAVVASAISTKSVFHIQYNPRASPSDYIIPFWKFSKSFNQAFSVGMRFKMRFETEDAAERRYTGLVTGIGDIDPIRWPGSKWKCLMVHWDDDMDGNRLNRVSPWEIEPSGSASSSGLFAPGSKRTKFSLPSVKADNPVPSGSGFSDFGESLRFQKVLQGQEITSFRTPYDAIDVSMRNHQSSEIRRSIPDVIPLGNSDTSFKGIGFGESLRFHKVLQGQEIFPLKAPHRGAQVDSYAQENGGIRVLEGVLMPNSGNRWPTQMHGYNTQMPLSTQVSSPSSVLMFQQSNQSMYGMNDRERTNKVGYYGLRDCPQVLNGNHTISACPPNPPSRVIHTEFKNTNDQHQNGRSGCKLFGFHLTNTPAANEIESDEMNFDAQFNQTQGRSRTKVHKQGSVVGRSIDLSKLDGYDGLICELERLFGMEGLLNDPGKGWQVVYTDDENDMMLVGDDPWQEFCNIASKILIYTHDEVLMMAAPHKTGDGAHSCSEEAPAVDVSKFSMGCNSSPTVM
ncbi:Auxin response factor 15 [Acorus calamus]|uniref:Auxin response factor n=1 Tax=Acorus calamus TaxID=4465 RepID=A0AAV9F7Y6_ACOCL|nr:Auxin response factor 15 [Acorus calamus]